VTTLDLTHVFIAPASDLSATLIVAQATQTVDEATPATVRRYAGGRDRVMTTPGRTVSTSVSFVFMDRLTYQLLLDLAGQVVLFRDQRQRRIWGVLANVSATEFNVRDLLESVSFTLTSVSVREAV